LHTELIIFVDRTMRKWSMPLKAKGVTIAAIHPGESSRFTVRSNFSNLMFHRLGGFD
jgi:hypothetical protein